MIGIAEIIINMKRALIEDKIGCFINIYVEVIYRVVV